MFLFHDVKDPKTAVEFADYGNFSSFFLCEKGSIGMLLNNRIYNLAKNAMCIIPPYSSLKFVRMSDDFEGWIMKMDMTDIAEAVLDLPIERKIEIRKDSCRYVSDIQFERVLGIKRVIEDRILANGEEGYFMAGNIVRSLKKALCLEMTQAFVSGDEYGEAHEDRKNEIFNIFLASVKAKFALEKNVSYYAEEQNLCPAYFSAVIKEVSGKSAKFWIENMTFTSAVNYLKNPNFPIREIAWLLNFPDQSSFGKYFKKISGHSPADFRKRYLL